MSHDPVCSPEQEGQVATALEGPGEDGPARMNENQTKWPWSAFNITKEIIFIGDFSR